MGYKFKKAPPPEDEFMQVVASATESGFDSARYYSWSWPVVKSVVTGLKTQKRVRDAVDTSREEVKQQVPANAEEFVDAWVSITVGKLAQASDGYPTNLLSQADAERLFQKMIQDGGGIPPVLEQAAGGKTDMMFQRMSNAILSAYANFGGDEPSEAGYA